MDQKRDDRTPTPPPPTHTRVKGVGRHNNNYNKTDGHSPSTHKLTGHNSWKTQSPLLLKAPYPPIYTLPTEFSQTSYCWQTNTTYPRARCTVISGSYPTTSIIMRANTCDPVLKLLNEEITSDIQKHKQNIWKKHLDAHWDHRHNTTFFGRPYMLYSYFIYYINHMHIIYLYH